MRLKKKKNHKTFHTPVKNECFLFWQRTVCCTQVTISEKPSNLLPPSFLEMKACRMYSEKIHAQCFHIFKSAYLTLFPATYLAALKKKVSYRNH